jgi:hypothetical protein
LPATFAAPATEPALEVAGEPLVFLEVLIGGAAIGVGQSESLAPIYASSVCGLNCGNTLPEPKCATGRGRRGGRTQCYPFARRER